MNEQRFRQLSGVLSDVSRETFHDLCLYEQLLRKWQSKIDLVANATLPDLWLRHILDSVQLFPLKPEAEN